MNKDCGIKIEYDKPYKEYYIFWEPSTTIGSGKNKVEALNDLQKAAHYSIDVTADSKLKEILKKD